MRDRTKLNRIHVRPQVMTAHTADALQPENTSRRADIPLADSLLGNGKVATDNGGAACSLDGASQRVPHFVLFAHESNKSTAFIFEQARLLWTKERLSSENIAMKQDVGTVIRTARKARGLVQKDVAKELGVTTAAVGQWERGENSLTMENLRGIGVVLGIDPSAAFQGELRYIEENPELVEVEQVSEPAQQNFGPRDVPIQAIAIGGDDDEFEFVGDVIDYARRPPGIAHLKNVFAVHILGTSMSPRFEPGELTYCGGRQALPGDDVVIELHPRQGETSRPGLVKRLVQRTAKEVIVRQFNPATELRYPASQVKTVHRIIPWKELLGF